MASRLDQALDEVIKDRRSERSGGSGRRYNNSRNNNNNRRDDFTRRRQVDNDGLIRKRLGPTSQSISSFVRTVIVKNSSGGDNFSVRSQLFSLLLFSKLNNTKNTHR
jgi:hypothetical protein